MQGLAWLRELQKRRAAATRLEELALSLEHNHRVEIRDIGREIRERMREADMADITDEELRRYANDSGWTVNRLAAECLRLRAAKSPDRERVRRAVRNSIDEYARYAEGEPMGGHVHVANDIADRAAEQLSATVDIDRAFLRRILSRTKHGPGGRVGNGSCDTDCVKCEAERRLDHPKPHHAGRQAIPVIDPSDTPELRTKIPGLGYTGDPGWQARVHAAADKIDRGANVVATPPDEEHPLGQLSVAPIPIRTPVEVVLAKLEAAAKAATAGKWDSPKEGPGSAYHAVVSDWGGSTEGYGGNLIGESFGPADGAYVVATQPAEILALIATVREMIPLVKDWASKERSEAAQIGWAVDSDFEAILNRALFVEAP